MAEVIFELAKTGKTDKQMAKALGITQQTIDNWKKAHPQFFGSLKAVKLMADSKVERSLYERACGYSHPAVKIMQCEGEPVIVPYIEHYPPDTNAARYWLNNRQPDKWRERLVHAGDPDNPIVTETRAIVVPKKDAVGEGSRSARKSVGAESAAG